MNDTERLNALEKLMWSDACGNGIAMFPCTISKTGERRVCLQDLGDEDGSCLGEELTASLPTLREAIDAACTANRTLSNTDQE